jgi:hypothetical protein
VLKRYSVPLAVAVVLALIVSTAVRAQELTSQEAKPVITVAFSGYEELISDLNFVGNLAGSPQLGANLEMATLLATGGRELKSLDRSKPWGGVVYADGPQFRGLAFVPLADLEELKGILETNAVEMEEVDGCLAASVNGQNVYLKSEGGWIFVSGKSANLENLPEDPAAALGGLQESYNLALRLDVQNVPQEMRDMLLSLLEMGMQGGMTQMPGESGQQYALRTKMASQTLEQLKRAVNELDAIQLGLAIDEKVPSIYLDIEVVAVPDTEMARRITAPKGMTTNFGGFVVSDAAVSYNGVSRLEPSQVEQVNVMIDGFRENIDKELDDQNLPEEIAKTSKQLVDDAFAILTSTMEGRELDLGTFFRADDEQATWLGGIRVADGSKVEDVLKTVVEEAAKELPELKEAVQFDAAEHAGVRLHTLTVPTSELGVPELSDLFGEELVIVVGAADKAAYVSVGSDSLAALKKAIDDSKAAKDLPPATVTVSVGTIAKLVAKYVPDEQAQAVANMIIAKLADSKGKDRITMTTTIPENGQKVRIEIEEDLLKVLGVLPAIVMGAAQMGG